MRQINAQEHGCRNQACHTSPVYANLQFTHYSLNVNTMAILAVNEQLLMSQISWDILFVPIFGQDR
jgi:hypothetical protein